jgi:hypothetical protein
VARARTSYLRLPSRDEGLDIDGDSVKWLREHYAGVPACRTSWCSRARRPMSAASLSARIEEYERSLPDHRSGTVDASVLHAMERFAPSMVNWSMETGCGKTTILLSNLSARHHVFAFDDRAEERSSIRYYEDCPLFKRECTTEVLGATQLTLPVYQFTEPIIANARELCRANEQTSGASFIPWRRKHESEPP